MAILNAGDLYINLSEVTIDKESIGWKDVIYNNTFTTEGEYRPQPNEKIDFEYYYRRGNKYFFRYELGLKMEIITDEDFGLKRGDVLQGYLH